MNRPHESRVLVGCPDARPPAYQAVAGLAAAGMLDRFVTAYYDTQPDGASSARLLPEPLHARWNARRARRRCTGIPVERVEPHPSYDVALSLENMLGRFSGVARRAIARARTDRFDRDVRRAVERTEPDCALIFSDVGSDEALPACRRLGVATVLGVVHGDVDEERSLLAVEAEVAPDFFPLYLGDGRLDLRELDRLHDRRRRDLEYADVVLVPSEHIAQQLENKRVDRSRIRVVPYAADVDKFRPDPDKTFTQACTFLFAGAITQRKGIKYLLEAWRKVRRPGWRLQLAGALPQTLGPLRNYLDEVEYVGRVGSREMPALMAKADVFVFPSLFEGSAVVTYEALASGLPCVVTPNAGSVVRDGVDGFLVPARDVDALAARIENLGRDVDLRAAASRAARIRALEFDWPRYQAAVIDAIRQIKARRVAA